MQYSRKRFQTMKLKPLLLLGLLALSRCPSAETLVEIYDLAHALSPEFRGQKAVFLAAEEQASQARAALLPSLLVTASGQRVHSRVDGMQVGTSLNSDGFPEPVVGLTEDNYSTYGYGLELRQALFDLERWHTYRQGSLIEQRQVWELKRAEQDLMLRCAEAYVAVLKAKGTLAIAEQESQDLEQQLKQMQRLFHAGLVARHDVLEVKAAKDRREVERIRMKNQLVATLENLRMLVGGRPVTTTSVRSDITLIQERLDDLQATSLEGNIDLILAIYELQENQATLQARKAQYLPKINLVASYHKDISENGAADYASGNATIGLTMEMNLLQGGSTRSRVREAHFQLEAARENLALLRHRYRNDAYILNRTVQSNITALEALTLTIESLQNAFDAADAGYRVGERDIMDVLLARTELFRARTEYTEALYNHLIDWLKLRRVMGHIHRDDLERLSAQTTRSDMGR